MSGSEAMDQTKASSHENEKPQDEIPTIKVNNKDDDEYVDIDHDDVEMHDAAAGGHRYAVDDLELQRFGNNIDDVGDDEEDSDEDHDHMAHHPLLSMLTGRLGQRRRGSVHKYDHLHPENQVLSVANVDECTELEAQAFPEHERAPREKFHYRLSRCPELSLGLFTQPTLTEAEKLSTPPKRRLVAYIVSTRTPSPSVTDASMAVPPNWQTNKSSLPNPGEKEPLGHQNTGGTVCIHSLAVAEEYRSLGLGSVILKSYIQRIKDAKCADRLALIAHDHLVNFYAGLGFENMGPSSVQSVGTGWNNMILEFGNDEEE